MRRTQNCGIAGAEGALLGGGLHHFGAFLPLFRDADASLHALLNRLEVPEVVFIFLGRLQL